MDFARLLGGGVLVVMFGAVGEVVPMTRVLRASTLVC